MNPHFCTKHEEKSLQITQETNCSVFSGRVIRGFEVIDGCRGVPLGRKKEKTARSKSIYEVIKYNLKHLFLPKPKFLTRESKDALATKG